MKDDLYKLPINKVTNWLLYGSFALLLLLSIIYEARPSRFQRSGGARSLASVVEEKNFPLHTYSLQNTSKIFIQGPLSSFSLHKERSTWRLNDPKKILVEEAKVAYFLSLFSKIRVLKHFDKGSFSNRQSFMIPNNPLKVSFATEAERLTLVFGRMDRLKGEAFLHFEHYPKIYLVEFSKIPVEELLPQYFIKKESFLKDVTKIKEVQIFRKNRSYLALRKYGENWVGKRNEKLSPDRVYRFMREIKNIPIKAVLDEKMEISSFVRRPSHRLILKLENKVIKFTMSQIRRNLPGLKISTRGDYLLSSTERDVPFIISQESFKLFQRASQNSLKMLKVSDIFY